MLHAGTLLASEEGPTLTDQHGRPATPIARGFRIFFTANQARIHAHRLSSAFLNRMLRIWVPSIDSGLIRPEEGRSRIGSIATVAKHDSFGIAQQLMSGVHGGHELAMVALAFHRHALELVAAGSITIMPGFNLSFRTLRHGLLAARALMTRDNSPLRPPQALCRALLATYLSQIPARKHRKTLRRGLWKLCGDPCVNKPTYATLPVAGTAEPWRTAATSLSSSMAALEHAVRRVIATALLAVLGQDRGSSEAVGAAQAFMANAFPAGATAHPTGWQEVSDATSQNAAERYRRAIENAIRPITTASLCDTVKLLARNACTLQRELADFARNASVSDCRHRQAILVRVKSVASTLLQCATHRVIDFHGAHNRRDANLGDAVRSVRETLGQFVTGSRTMLSWFAALGMDTSQRLQEQFLADLASGERAAAWAVQSQLCLPMRRSYTQLRKILYYFVRSRSSSVAPASAILPYGAVLLWQALAFHASTLLPDALIFGDATDAVAPDVETVVDDHAVAQLERDLAAAVLVTELESAVQVCVNALVPPASQAAQHNEAHTEAHMTAHRDAEAARTLYDEAKQAADEAANRENHASTHVEACANELLRCQKQDKQRRSVVKRLLSKATAVAQAKAALQEATKRLTACRQDSTDKQRLADSALERVSETQQSLMSYEEEEDASKRRQHERLRHAVEQVKCVANTDDWEQLQKLVHTTTAQQHERAGNMLARLHTRPGTTNADGSLCLQVACAGGLRFIVGDTMPLSDSWPRADQPLSITAMDKEPRTVLAKFKRPPPTVATDLAVMWATVFFGPSASSYFRFPAHCSIHFFECAPKLHAKVATLSSEDVSIIVLWTPVAPYTTVPPFSLLFVDRREWLKGGSAACVHVTHFTMPNGFNAAAPDFEPLRGRPEGIMHGAAVAGLAHCMNKDVGQDVLVVTRSLPMIKPQDMPFATASARVALGVLCTLARSTYLAAAGSVQIRSDMQDGVVCTPVTMAEEARQALRRVRQALYGSASPVSVQEVASLHAQPLARQLLCWQGACEHLMARAANGTTSGACCGSQCVTMGWCQCSPAWCHCTQMLILCRCSKWAL